MHSSNDLLDRISSLGTIVSVWAHPDDETYLAGGVMSIARHLGQSVTCITATPGDFAPVESDRPRIAEIRSAELVAALDILGVDDHVQLGLRDGECERVDDESEIDRIAVLLADRAPDTILTFGPDGLTGHPDHRAVARWTAAAARVACPTALVLVPAVTAEMSRHDRDINDRFDVYEPGLPTVQHVTAADLDVQIDGARLDIKYRALCAHATQTAGLIDAIGPTRYRRWISREPYIPLERWSAGAPTHDVQVSTRPS